MQGIFGPVAAWSGIGDTHTFEQFADPADYSNWATLITDDASVGGSWIGTWGANGYSIANVGQSLPGWATLTWGYGGGQPVYTWADNLASTVTRAVQKPATPTLRIGSVWFHSSYFDLTVAVTDGGTHGVALYMCDYPQTENRSMKVEWFDATSGKQLGTTRTYAPAGLYNGMWLAFAQKGSMRFRFTNISGPNSILNAIFFDSTAYGSLTSESRGKSRGYPYAPTGTGHFNSPRSRHADRTPIAASATFTSESKTSRGGAHELGRAAVLGWSTPEVTMTGRGTCTWAPFELAWNSIAQGTCYFPWLASSGRVWTADGTGETDWAWRGAGSDWWTSIEDGVCEWTPSAAAPAAPTRWTADGTARTHWELGARTPRASCMTGDGDWDITPPGTGTPRNEAY